MPLIDVTLRPGYVFSDTDGRNFGPQSTRQFIRKTFGPELPGLFVRNSARFNLEPGTPEVGIQVQFHDYDADDLNVPDIWIKVQFSEERPKKSGLDIRDAVFGAIVGVFHNRGLRVPDNFVLDVFWGPTNGCGSVNGTYIEW